MHLNQRAGCGGRLPRPAYLHWLLVALCAIGCSRQPRTITILHTADVHGHIYNWNYAAGRESDQGLAIVSGIVKQERRVDRRLLLLDAGDTIQGSPLAHLFSVKLSGEPNPMALVMNAMKYDAMTVGNHEYNFGQGVLDKFIAEAKFPVLSANIRTVAGEQKYTPYVLKKVRGVQVGILGLTTVGIPSWEKPGHIAGLRFDNAVMVAREFVPQMQAEGAQVILALVHTGTHIEPPAANSPGAWRDDYKKWDEGGAGSDEVNFAIRLAEEVPEVDVILGGHTHRFVPSMTVSNTLIVQPGMWGRAVTKVVLELDQRGRVTTRRGDLIWATGREPDPTILKIARKFHDRTLEYLGRPIGTATGDFPGGFAARRKDGPLVDLISTVQLEVAAAAGFPVQVSSAAVFSDSSLRTGEITPREVYGIYKYENALSVVEITGAILRRALEHSAGYWARWDPDHPPAGGLREHVAKGARSYNWDLFTGVEYRIDISRPVGKRVVQLRYEGEDVRPDQKFRIAINSYRATGGGGYTMYKEGRLLWDSATEIRDALLEHIEKKGTISPEDYFVPNWSLLPEELNE